MVKEPARVGINGNNPVEFATKLFHLILDEIREEPIGVQTTLAKFGFDIMEDLVLNPHGPNFLLGESTIMVKGGRNFFNLRLRASNTFNFKPNMFVLRRPGRESLSMPSA